MAHPFKPAGYNSVSPYLVVEGAQKMIDFLASVFGGKVLRRYEGEEGKIVHCEVRVDDSVIMLADSTANWPPNKLLIHVYVPDVEATFRKAVEAGCEVVGEPREQEGDPDRRGTLKDFSGNFWSVSTQIHADGA